jgi:hypothetical protein
MLIPYAEVIALLRLKNIEIHGALHIGAHDCEELDFYKKLGLNQDDIIWIDGNRAKVNHCVARGIKNVFYGLISDKDDAIVTFHISNNGQSSSILDFGTHSRHHSHVFYVNEEKHKTITIDTFLNNNNFDMSKYDFWNFDIQGAELLALKGALSAINHAKVLYLEVNTEEVYKGCALIDELDTYLSTFGFKREITKITEFGWGDAVYIKV